MLQGMKTLLAVSVMPAAIMYMYSVYVLYKLAT